ncbi:hypothetical protein OUZ56_026583 [Daphnia magna]|uniref:Uncharacterized protein n=1 Tax=Daphnia magna TaxID=35525 RepID=A0ABQ9ZMA4_9CRUS|nr:hypothetical protein OUZ56_026583 [Daphnia magna]
MQQQIISMCTSMYWITHIFKRSGIREETNEESAEVLALAENISAIEELAKSARQTKALKTLEIVKLASLAQDFQGQFIFLSACPWGLFHMGKPVTTMPLTLLGIYLVPNIRQHELDDGRDFHHVLIYMIWVALVRRPPSYNLFCVAPPLGLPAGNCTGQGARLKQKEEEEYEENIKEEKKEEKEKEEKGKEEKKKEGEEIAIEEEEDIIVIDIDPDDLIHLYHAL